MKKSAEVEYLSLDRAIEQSELLVNKRWLARMFAPSLAFVMLCVVVIPLLFSEETTLAAPYRYAALLLALVIVASFFWVEVRAGRFVLAADKNGFCYRLHGQKDKAVCLSWTQVKDIRLLAGVGDNEVVVYLELTELFEPPRPALAEVVCLDGNWELRFYPGWGNSAKKIVEQLKVLRGRGTSE